MILSVPIPDTVFSETTLATTTIKAAAHELNIEIVNGIAAPTHLNVGSNVYPVTVTVTLTNLGDVGARVVVSAYVYGGPSNVNETSVGAGKEVVVTITLYHQFARYGPGKFAVTAAVYLYNNLVKLDNEVVGTYTIPVSSVVKTTTINVTRATAWVWALDSFLEVTLNKNAAAFYPTPAYYYPTWVAEVNVTEYNVSTIVSATYDTMLLYWYWTTETISNVVAINLAPAYAPWLSHGTYGITAHVTLKMFGIVVNKWTYWLTSGISIDIEAKLYATYNGWYSTNDFIAVEKAEDTFVVEYWLGVVATFLNNYNGKVTYASTTGFELSTTLTAPPGWVP